MQPTNRYFKERDRCVYCGSTAKGKGCRFAPHGVHFHPNDSTKCAYCGSPAYGKGCKINPISDMHIHGIDFNIMFKEHVQNFLSHKVLLNELKKSFKEFRAYQLNLIDENGSKIKDPVTEEEKNALNPYVKTIIRLKKYLGPKLDLIEAEFNLDDTTMVSEDIEEYKTFLDFKDKIDNNINELYKILEEAKLAGLSQKSIKKLINA